jgi:hypothetical protein
MALQRQKFSYPGPTRILSAKDALTFVVSSAGASLVRDSVDTQLIAELTSYGRKGALISDEASMGGVGTIKGGTKSVDTDGDGIPDEAEKKLGFDVAKEDAMVLNSEGYAHVEAWANSLVKGGY